MREEFLPAFDAWLDDRHRGHDVPDGTPFELPRVPPRREEKAKLLEAQASKLFEDGNESNQVSDDFVLAAVLFASVLFFSGLGGHVRLAPRADHPADPGQR